MSGLFPHLQRQDLARLAGKLLMQEVTGTGRAGEEETIDVPMTRQGLAGIDLSLHQIDDTGRQTRLLPDLEHGLGHHGVSSEGLNTTVLPAMSAGTMWPLGR